MIWRKARRQVEETSKVQRKWQHHSKWSSLCSKDTHRTRTPLVSSVQCFKLIIASKTLWHDGYCTSRFIAPLGWFQFDDIVFQIEHFQWVLKQVCRLVSSVNEFNSDFVIKVSLPHLAVSHLSVAPSKFKHVKVHLGACNQATHTSSALLSACFGLCVARATWTPSACLP
jgi:hypothetical protein